MRAHFSGEGPGFVHARREGEVCQSIGRWREGGNWLIAIVVCEPESKESSSSHSSANDSEQLGQTAPQDNVPRDAAEYATCFPLSCTCSSLWSSSVGTAGGE